MARRSLASTSVRKSDVPEGYIADPTLGPMLTYQNSLPHLPVPTIASTTAKYLESVQPHLTPDQFAKTKVAVEDFASSKLAKELQERLIKRADGSTSWLSEWWNEAAYMGYRDPVVVFVSYYFVHVDDKLRRTPVKRAAALLRAMLPFRELVETQQLEPDKVRKAPLCMSSYKWLFNSSRYPTIPNDTAEKHDPQQNNHVVFIRKNKFFAVPLEVDGVSLSTAELESQISQIFTLAGPTPATPLGVLTSDNRDIWTHARQSLIAASPTQNAASLKKIDAAVIIVALDDTKPVTREAISYAALSGDGRNRWFDKHQLIVFDNGRSAFLGEHSCMDGTPTLRLNEYMVSSVARGTVDHGSPTVRPNLPAPQEIKFVLDDTTLANIKVSEKNFDKLVGEHDMHVLHYEGYGASQIKKHKASPDAWVQLVKQLAFYKMYQRPAVTYESAQTRKFQLGRTEVIRAASNESKAFVDSMVDPEVSDTVRAALFRKAVSRHLLYAGWAADGQGVDRHLFGLKKLLKEGEPTPAIYTDEAFGKTNHWELSTSQLSSPWFDGWGYGEVVPDGYGLAYAIGSDYIRWSITSLKRDGDVFKHYLAEAASEVRDMMDRAAKEAAAAAPAGEKAKL